MKPLPALLVPLLMLLPAAFHGLSAAKPARPGKAELGRTMAQENCAACHAIGRTGFSANPNAPPFPAVVNQEGLTAKTLTTFLRGAHNYPREMDFYLNAAKVDLLVAYMITLKDPNYRRPED